MSRLFGSTLIASFLTFAPAAFACGGQDCACGERCACGEKCSCGKTEGSCDCAKTDGKCGCDQCECGKGEGCGCGHAPEKTP